MAAKNQFDLARFFQALGDPTRLRLLNLMGDSEICVCHLVEILNSAQPKISRHLAYLHRAGIVMPPHRGAAQVLMQTLETPRGEKAMQADTARLARA